MTNKQREEINADTHVKRFDLYTSSLKQKADAVIEMIGEDK